MLVVWTYIRVHCGTQEDEVEDLVGGATQGIRRLGTAVQMSYTNSKSGFIFILRAGF